MCGRFNVIASAEALAEHFALPAPPPAIRPRYNIAPTQSISVVALQRDRVTRGLAQIPWGIVPEWADGPARAPGSSTRGPSRSRSSSGGACGAAGPGPGERVL
ncbi:Uncharacterized protein OS=Caldilinea aerophila (strain DSM 14535 / JCM 11387 / NBRC 104270 / STL-6-O1) GN=CLDAP_37660 PE=4 SV=1: DUF159 [Gemmataceae bacterium]|nr:Uncharacterized protein OS=Caldilinea aerophila (strain DSM 14535 / JCM 11387 / NBRC 104270 / STL-6-O1) GN=CLDAP_37660 PE=4 SV=1: DUF159 [Gemmataceae bacterium]VTU00900.1 Uncharacterized protein OS=Caldilinea aerophila (strain DSM 14535 / JCM 11387 / NBRC 104270 / STL-6-O1) GN=CLDAP_37660 PE=4 SV=1: DUF159 [Gemmataceae bacterium]